MMRPPATSNRRTSQSKPTVSPNKVDSETASAAVPRYRGSVPKASPAQKQPSLPSSLSHRAVSSHQISKPHKKSAINSDISDTLA